VLFHSSVPSDSGKSVGIRYINVSTRLIAVPGVLLLLFHLRDAVKT
jgi:hypothetical protein